MLVTAASGLGAGAVLGASIASETEWKIRGDVPGLVIFPRNSFVGIILNQLIALCLIAAAMALIGLGTLYLGGAYPVRADTQMIWAVSLLAGGFIAKWLRYRYWKRRSQWTFDE